MSSCTRAIDDLYDDYTALCELMMIEAVGINDDFIEIISRWEDLYNVRGVCQLYEKIKSLTK